MTLKLHNFINDDVTLFSLPLIAVVETSRMSLSTGDTFFHGWNFEGRLIHGWANPQVYSIWSITAANATPDACTMCTFIYLLLCFVPCLYLQNLRWCVCGAPVSYLAYNSPLKWFDMHTHPYFYSYIYKTTSSSVSVAQRSFLFWNHFCTISLEGHYDGLIPLLSMLLAPTAKFQCCSKFHQI